MTKVLGVGGVFFKSPDPERLFQWYQQWLGISRDSQPGVAFEPKNMPQKSLTVWSAFESSTRYFSPSTKDFMFNFVVSCDGEHLVAHEM